MIKAGGVDGHIKKMYIPPMNMGLYILFCIMGVIFFGNRGIQKYLGEVNNLERDKLATEMKTLKVCLSCGEQVKIEAKVCRYCTRDL